MTNADSSFELCSFDILSAFELRHSSFRPRTYSPTYLLTLPSPCPASTPSSCCFAIASLVPRSALARRSRSLSRWRGPMWMSRTWRSWRRWVRSAKARRGGGAVDRLCDTHARTAGVERDGFVGRGGRAGRGVRGRATRRHERGRRGRGAAAAAERAGRNRFWVTMATYSFRDTIESAVSAFGGRLAVLAHRAGCRYRSVATPREVSIGGASSSGADR